MKRITASSSDVRLRTAARVKPDPATAPLYEKLYATYGLLYPSNREHMHVLAALGGSMMPLEFFSPTMLTVAHFTPHAWAAMLCARIAADVTPQVAAPRRQVRSAR